jgi:predicted glycoside hydrolase/deacetylase ChbG (UPF0249 family)
LHPASVRHPLLIVTGDDLGLNLSTTQAVSQSLRDRIVSHASLIVNMPVFDQACELVLANRLERRVGLHFNLTEGAPLTDAIRRQPRFCTDGQFTRRDFYAGLRPLSNDAKRTVAAEARAQVALARSRGIPLTHLDSHNDVHLLPNLTAIVAAVAAESGITRVRPARNIGTRQGILRFVLNRRYNAWLRRKGLRQVRYFGTIDDLVWLAARRPLGDCSAEVMTHPILGPGGTIVDAPSAEPLADRLRRLQQHFPSYSGQDSPDVRGESPLLP